jgi:hypothetical protein
MILAFSAVLAGAVALYVLGPILGWGSPAPLADTGAREADRRRELLDRRQETLAGLKDLTMEYEVGKLTREDYEQQREKLTREAVEIYRELDKDGAA